MQQEINVTKHLIDNIKPFKKYLFIHIFVISFMAIDSSLWPYVSKLLIDKITTIDHDQFFQQIWPLAVALIILTILPGLVWRLADYAWTYLTPLIKKKVMIDSTEKMLVKSQNFYQNNQSGACANRIKELSVNTPNLLNMILYNFIGVLLGLVIALYTTWHTHKFFAITLFFWSIIFIFMALRSAKLTDQMSANIAIQQSKIIGNLVDILTNIQNIKFFTRQKDEAKRVGLLQNRYMAHYKRRGFFLLKFYTLHGFTFSLYFSASIIALIYFYSKGEVTIGDFTLIFTINSWMIHSMWHAASQIQGFLEDFGAVKQALKMLYRPLEVEDKENASELELKTTKGAKIEFDKVSFSYRLLAKTQKEFKNEEDRSFAGIDKKNALLAHKEDLHLTENLVIESGEKIGLVGHSGSGKSTFVNLLMRSYDINSGKITIDGQNICNVTQDSLHKKITIIAQDPMLFHRTIYENISYAKSQSSKEEVQAAAKKAYCHEFIENLPKKYRTLVGDRGVKLSGGQRQRLAIARAFLENAPILIMDESTSQLDSVTERLIQNSLAKLMKNKTVFVVAHRFSTLKNVDRILMFDSGRIIEQGTHEDLLSLGGAYKEMWEEQIETSLNFKSV